MFRFIKKKNIFNSFIMCKSVKCNFIKLYFDDKVRPEIINVNSDEPVFYHFSIKT